MARTPDRAIQIATAACSDAVDALLNGHRPEQPIATFRTALGEVPLKSASAAFRQFRYVLTRLTPPHYIPRAHRRTLPGMIFRKRRPELDWLEAWPAFGWILQHHSDGYLREEALLAISDAPQNAFEIYALAERMNDWVPQVRYAAVDRFKAYLGDTAPDVVAECALHLLPRLDLLQRWDRNEIELVEEVLYQPHVLNVLCKRLLEHRQGSVVRAFRRLLRCSAFDEYLARCALEAISPAIRAAAIDTLLMSRARWFVSYQREWVDKTMGLTRRVAVFDSRPTTISSDIDQMFHAAAHDRAAQVRKIAGDWLVAHVKDAPGSVQVIARNLAKDRSAGVRSRAEYFLRNCA